MSVGPSDGVVRAGRFRNGVVPRGTEGATTKESTHRQPRSTARTVGLDGFAGVFGTRGGEPAGRRAAFAADLVEVDGPEQGRPDTGPGRAHGRSNVARTWGTDLARSSKVTAAAGRVRPHK